MFGEEVKKKRCLDEGEATEAAREGVVTAEDMKATEEGARAAGIEVDVEGTAGEATNERTTHEGTATAEEVRGGEDHREGRKHQE